MNKSEPNWWEWEPRLEDGGVGPVWEYQRFHSAFGVDSPSYDALETGASVANPPVRRNTGGVVRRGVKSRRTDSNAAVRRTRRPGPIEPPAYPDLILSDCCFDDECKKTLDDWKGGKCWDGKVTGIHAVRDADGGCTWRATCGKKPGLEEVESDLCTPVCSERQSPDSEGEHPPVGPDDDGAGDSEAGSGCEMFVLDDADLPLADEPCPEALCECESSCVAWTSASAVPADERVQLAFAYIPDFGNDAAIDCHDLSDEIADVLNAAWSLLLGNYDIAMLSTCLVACHDHAGGAYGDHSGISSARAIDRMARILTGRGSDLFHDYTIYVECGTSRRMVNASYDHVLHTVTFYCKEERALFRAISAFGTGGALAKACASFNIAAILFHELIHAVLSDDAHDGRGVPRRGCSASYRAQRLYMNFMAQRWPVLAACSEY